MRVFFALILMLSQLGGQQLAKSLPSMLDAWSLIVLLEKSDNGHPRISIIKNVGENALNQDNLPHFMNIFANEVAQLDNEAIIYSPHPLNLWAI